MNSRKINLVNFSLILFFAFGCSTTNVYVETSRKGRLEYAEELSNKKLNIEPKKIEKNIQDIKVRVEYIPQDELKNLFKDKKKFGKFAGENPFPKETIVFLVRISNNSLSKIKVTPSEFVVIDDLGNQYLYLNPDHIMAMYKSKSVVYSFTKSTQALASGIYGAPADLASTIAGRKMRKKFYLLKQVELSGGYVYPSVVYDGYISFLKPIKDAKKLKLILAEIKTKFDVNDEALGNLNLEFDFNIK
jgi:hypothetical protein